MMEKILDINGVEVYVAKFLPEEIAAGQIAGQKLAVSRMLREVLGDGAGLSHRADGSPVAVGEWREISVSHCAGMAALAVGGTSRIGVDIEMPRPTLMRVARRFLSERELELWTSMADLLRAWTIKEAMYKAAGERGVDFAREVVLPDKDASPGIGSVVRRGKNEAHYELHSALYAGGCLTLALPLSSDDYSLMP